MWVSPTTSEDDSLLSQLDVTKRLSSPCSVTSSWGLSSTASTQWRRRLSQKAKDGSWKLRHQDIQLEEELSQTLKSKVQLGKWNGTRVVVKTLIAPSLRKEEDAEDMANTVVALTDELLHEIETLSSLRHPDLVMFLGACLDVSAPLACVMKYMPGGDLHHYYLNKRKKHEARISERIGSSPCCSADFLGKPGSW